jgi:hypothetical protein
LSESRKFPERDTEGFLNAFLRRYPVYPDTSSKGALPRFAPPLWNLTQHAPGGGGRKSGVRAVPDEVRTANGPRLQADLMRTMRHFRARSFVDRGPKKSGPDIEIKTVRDLKKKEKKMRLGRLPVNLSASTLSAIKKRAMNSGKSASEIVRELVESGLNNPSGFRDGSGAGHGP